MQACSRTVLADGLFLKTCKTLSLALAMPLFSLTDLSLTDLWQV